MPDQRPKPPANCYWRGGILWGRISIKGTPHRFSLRTRDGRLAAKRLAEKRRRALGAAYFGEIRHSYQEAFVAWSAWIAGQVGGKTAQRYAVSLGQLELELTPRYVDEISAAIISEIVTRRRQACTIATIRRDLTALSSLLGFCESMQWREGNPALSWLRRLRERRDPIVRPQLKDVEATIALAPPMLGAMMRIALATGAREDELAGARRAHFDAQARQLTLIGKGNKLRVIDLEPFGAFALIDALPVFLKSPFLFWHGEGEPYRNVASRFTALVKRAQAASGESFRRFRFHHLRHEHAITWLKSGRNIYDLQQRLGHASIKTTEIYLAYLTPEEVRAVKYGAA